MSAQHRNSKRSDQEWIALIQECRTSGLGDKDWCEQQGIPISSFYSKITKLRHKACDIPRAQRHILREKQQVVPVSITDAAPAVYAVPEQVPADTGASAVILKIQDYSIEIFNHASRETIFNVLSVLQQLC